jgi:hypothetical protein
VTSPVDGRGEAEVLGRRIARLLAGSWRGDPGKADLDTEELDSIVEHVLESGGGALGWRRIRSTSCALTEAGQALQTAYRWGALMAVRRRGDVAAATLTLRRGGVDPLLFKGLAAARLYPEEGLRPWDDIDFGVPARSLALAQSFLDEAPALGTPVDLHAHAVRVGRRALGHWRFDALRERAATIDVGTTVVRTLGREDHLRLLCLHALRHEVWRAPWLCDVGAAVEMAGDDFDWDLCLGRGREADWVLATIALAHELLGAGVDAVPERRRAARPTWLSVAVLKRWGVRPSVYMALRRPAFHELVAQGGDVRNALRVRWPSAIEATVTLRRRFNRTPRQPFQALVFAGRVTRSLVRLPRDLAGGRPTPA